MSPIRSQFMRNTLGTPQIPQIGAGGVPTQAVSAAVAPAQGQPITPAVQPQRQISPNTYQAPPPPHPTAGGVRPPTGNFTIGDGSVPVINTSHPGQRPPGLSALQKLAAPRG